MVRTLETVYRTDMKKILIVDDSKAIRELVRITLDPDAYEVLEADTGEAGVEAACGNHPDLIVMDVKMPGRMDGFEAINAIRAHQKLKGVPVIVLSGAGEPGCDEVRLFETGELLYFKKPFSPLDLIEKIDEILGTAA